MPTLPSGRNAKKSLNQNEHVTCEFPDNHRSKQHQLASVSREWKILQKIFERNNQGSGDAKQIYKACSNCFTKNCNQGKKTS